MMIDDPTASVWPRIQYIADGSRTDFEFFFPLSEADDLVVFAGEALATGFSVTGGGDGGTVMFAMAPAAGTSLTLLRRSESVRRTEFVDGAAFRAAAVNAEFDHVFRLIQEHQEAGARSLGVAPVEGKVDLCLPAAAARAGKILGFDESGSPITLGISEVEPQSDGSGLVVTSFGTTSPRALGSRFSSPFDIRDFGAVGDGVSDDTSAFLAAIDAAASSHGKVRVPGAHLPYVLTGPLVLDGITLEGDGPKSVIRLGLSAGPGLILAGVGSRVAGMRCLGPGASSWPVNAQQVDLAAVSLDAIEVATDAKAVSIERVDIAACRTGINLAGPIATLRDCGLYFAQTGIEVLPSCSGTLPLQNLHVEGCTTGIRIDGDALVDQVALTTGQALACGTAIDLQGLSSGRRSIDIVGFGFVANLEQDLTAGPRQSIGLRNCSIDNGGRTSGFGVELLSAGTSTEAPALIVENSDASRTAVLPITLSSGTTLDQVQRGDLLVLSTDADEFNEHWTGLLAERAGIIHAVTAQTTGTAHIELASVGQRPLPVAGDTIRIVGRAGTAVVGSLGAATVGSHFAWLRLEDHCRAFAVNTPVSADHISLGGPDAVVHTLPARSDEPAAIGGVELEAGQINGALVRLHTFEIAQDSAVSFAPASAVGMVHAFGHGSLGDLTAAVFSYRADSLGYIQLLAASAGVGIVQRTPLTGTTGEDNSLSYATNTDGTIHIENRLSGPPRKISLLVVGAPV